MATHYRTKAVILKKKDRGEADRLFTCFTENFGKLELRATSERKITSKLRGGLELFYLSDIEFIQGKFQKTLTQAFCVNSYRQLRKDLLRLQIAHRISELFDTLIKGEEREDAVWNLLEESFGTLNRNDIPTQAHKVIPYYVLWNLVSLLGYKPQLHEFTERDHAAVDLFLEKSLQESLERTMADEERKALRDTSRQYLSKMGL